MESRDAILQTDDSPAVKSFVRWLIQTEEADLGLRLAELWAMSDSTLPLERSDFLAESHFAAKRYPAAAEWAKDVIRQTESSPAALLNHAKCANRSGDLAGAQASLEAALEKVPGWIDARLELGYCLAAQGEKESARRVFLELIPDVSPGSRDHLAVEFNLACDRIEEGDFQGGMRQLCQARKVGLWGSPFDPPPGIEPLSCASDLQGKSVLVIGEGGIGDELIGARFGRSLKARGARVTWATGRDDLISPLSRVQGIDCVERISQLSSADYYVCAMDLPVALGIGAHELWTGPYLSALPEYQEKWRSRIVRKEGLNVGLRWQGNPLYEADLGRTIPFNVMKKLGSIPGANFFAIQRDAGSEQWHPGSGVENIGEGLVTWEDTLGAISSLDLVISSCTSVVHAALALGVETWVLLPHLSYYVWSGSNERSLWYDGARFFRRGRGETWDEVINRVHEQLSVRAASQIASRL